MSIERNIMKTTLTAAFALASGLYAAGAANAAGIADTKHNLSSASGLTSNEICVFCHTPHGSDTSAAVPLWNKKLPASNTFTTYDTLGTSTLDGKGAGGTTALTVGSVSLACLSCHDGSQSTDTVLNKPGSGGYVAAGSRMGNAADGAIGGKLTYDPSSPGANGEISKLGTDLTNDHPIGIEYGKWSGATNDPDFVMATKDGTRNIWWVDNSAAGNTAGRDKTDMWLYTRDVSGTAKPFVECASCHDPHSTNSTFLRTSNSASAVCLSCHTK